MEYLTLAYIPGRIYGVTCLQLYLYYTQHCNKDSLFMKLYVRKFELFMLSLANSGRRLSL